MPPKPIPEPTAYGLTRTTDQPLYWCTYGPPGASRILVLHGGPGAHHDYLLPQMLALADVGPGRELVFYDQRGGGRSKTQASEHVTWETQVGDAAAVAREFELGRPVIVGYSWGGLLALLCAGRAEKQGFPQPAALVVIDPAPISRQYRSRFEHEFGRRQASPEVQELRRQLNESNLRDRDPEAYRQRNFELSVAGYFAHPASAQDLTPFRVSARVQESVWDSLGDFDLVADGTLSSIQAPTLIVHGRQDPIPVESSEKAASVMGAELVVLDNCGHVPYVEQPAALFGAIDAFLSGTAKRTARSP